MTLPNFTFGQLCMWNGANKYDFLDEWFWAMFEPTPIWSNYGPEGRPYSNQRVRPFVRPSVRSSQIVFADG